MSFSLICFARRRRRRRRWEAFPPVKVQVFQRDVAFVRYTVSGNEPGWDPIWDDRMITICSYGVRAVLEMKLRLGGGRWIWGQEGRNILCNVDEAGCTAS